MRRWEGVLLDDGAGFALGCGHAHRSQDLAARCVSMEVGYCDWVRPYRKSTRGAWVPSDYSVMVRLTVTGKDQGNPWASVPPPDPSPACWPGRPKADRICLRPPRPTGVRDSVPPGGYRCESAGQTYGWSPYGLRC